MDFICTISSFLIAFFGHLTFLEKVLCTTHMILLILLFLFPFSRHVLSCFLQASCNTSTTTDARIASRTCSSWFKLSALCCVYMLFLQIVVLGNVIYVLLKSIGQDKSQHGALYLSILQVISWLVMSISVLCSWFKASTKQPFLVRLWWVVSFALCVLVGYVDLKEWWAGKLKPSSLTVANFISFPPLVFLSVAAFGGFTGIDVTHKNGGIHERLLLVEENNRPRATSYDNATILGLLTLSWVSPILSIGAKRHLDLNDVPLLPSRDCSETSYRSLVSNWESFKLANPNKNPSLAMVILRSFWKEAAWYAVFATLDTFASYVGPYLVHHFVDYLSGEEATGHKGFVLVAIIFVAMLIENLMARQWSMGAELIGIHVRSALTAVVYKKGLRLASYSRKNHTSGVIVHYMSVDVQRIGDFASKIYDIWNLPLQIILGVAILYKSVGHAYVATLIAIAISILITIPLTRIQNCYQTKLMSAKSERLRKTSECIRNMRVLKLHAWEERYRLKVEELRKVEQRWLKSSSYLKATMTFVLWASPIFVAVVTFSTSMLLGNKLTTGGIISALATFKTLQEPLRSFPDVVSTYAQMKVSLTRISRFLHEGELPEDVNMQIPHCITTNAIEILDGVFSWDPSSSKPTLSGIHLEAEKGMRVAVCGVVGSGKSSFLSSILGEIPKLSGEVKVSGSLAYVPQTAWIQSGNIEENILFGSPMDQTKYKRILHVCSLEKDLELLCHGDQTLIGDRGINLSGGQKQRIQLARALYQDADIYLLDDPFSALDAHTGSEVFREYILIALASKTVVYVTHQVEFLSVADKILVLKDGHIAEAGKYKDLLQLGTYFISLVSAHKEAIQTINMSDLPDKEINLVKHGEIFSQTSSVTGGIIETPTIDGPVHLEKKVIADKPFKRDEEREKGRVSFRVYLSYLTAAYKGALVPVVMFAIIMFQLLQIWSNWWMAWANPRKEGEAPKKDKNVILVVYVGLAFGSSLFVLLKGVLITIFSLVASQQMFLNILKSIFRAPLSFFDSTPSGRILNRVSVDQSVVDFDLPEKLTSFATTTIQLLAIIGVMCQSTWQVLILILPMAAAGLWLQKYYMASARELVRISSIQKSPGIHHFEESIAGAATIRGSCQEKRFMERNLYLLDCFNRPAFYQFCATEWLRLRMELLSTIVLATCMALILRFPRESIDPSWAGLTVTYGLEMNNRLSRWILCFCKIENKIISIERINQYCKIPSEALLTIENCCPPFSWPQHGTIKLLNLKVRYNETLPFVLNGVTCNFPGGSKIGIVGRTGSGKSTLVQALFRLVEPTEGTILVDGIDVSTIGLHDLRSKLSIIPQDPTLFEGTVRENLDPLQEHRDHEIWEALYKCQLGEAIQQKSEKLDSSVFENGENWSVGQHQLFALGRALLKKAKILVLDEATASVDTATDNLIQHIIRREFRDFTVITIAHRIATVMESDLVLVLDAGKAVEFDKPRCLLDNPASTFVRLVSEYAERSSSILAA